MTLVSPPRSTLQCGGDGGVDGDDDDGDDVGGVSDSVTVDGDVVVMKWAWSARRTQYGTRRKWYAPSMTCESCSVLLAPILLPRRRPCGGDSAVARGAPTYAASLLPVSFWSLFCL